VGSGKERRKCARGEHRADYPFVIPCPEKRETFTKSTMGKFRPIPTPYSLLPLRETSKPGWLESVAVTGLDIKKRASSLNFPGTQPLRLRCHYFLFYSGLLISTTLTDLVSIALQLLILCTLHLHPRVASPRAHTPCPETERKEERCRWLHLSGGQGTS
jgi:hypothetical protein